MCGLRAYGKAETKRAARQAAEVFLSRRLAFRRSDGSLIRDDFAKLHYPLYYHYDILGGLKALRDLDLLADPRCADALDLLESMGTKTAGRPTRPTIAPPTASVGAAPEGGVSTPG
jgi:hypothetical protein